MTVNTIIGSVHDLRSPSLFASEELGTAGPAGMAFDAIRLPFGWRMADDRGYVAAGIARWSLANVVLSTKH